MSKKKNIRNIKNKWETFKEKHPVCLFILESVSKLVGIIISILFVYFALRQDISSNLGTSIAQASLNLQKLQLEKPFFRYAYSAEANGIIIRHNENINIKQTAWIFPTSSTINRYDLSDGNITIVSSTPGKLRWYLKYDATLSLQEFYRTYQEELENFPEIKNQSNIARVKFSSFMFNEDPSGYGYLRCRVFPTIQNITEPGEPGGIPIGVKNLYEKLDGTINTTYDLLTIRETRKKVPEINIYYRDISEDLLRKKLAIFLNKFHGAVTGNPFDENFAYIDGNGNCTQTGWEYIITP